MAKIVFLREVTSIKAGPGSTILEDGTIQDPELYEAIEITCDDGTVFQVERPLTRTKVKAAYDETIDKHTTTIDEVSIGDHI